MCFPSRIPIAATDKIELDGNDQYKTAIITHNGLYKYTRMQLVLMNATATFQRIMDVILASVK